MPNTLFSSVAIHPLGENSGCVGPLHFSDSAISWLCSAASFLVVIKKLVDATDLLSKTIVRAGQ